MCKFKKIGIFGHYGNKNLGDEAIILAVIQNLRLRIPDLEIQCFSINPSDSTARYNVTSYPIRREKITAAVAEQAEGHSEILCAQPEIKTEVPTSKLHRIKNTFKKVPFVFSTLKFIKKIIELPFLIFKELCFLRASFRAVKGVDILLFTGSNQFLDNFGGSWGFPYTLFKWSLLARIAGKKIAHISVGAGPLDKFLSKSFILGSVSLSEYLSFRDKGSKELTKRFLGFKSGHVFPDLAHSLRWENELDEKTNNHEKERLIVGINPMPIYDKRYWHIADDAKYKEFIEKIGNFTMDLIVKNFDVVLFGTHPKDKDVSHDILNYLSLRAEKELLTHCFIRSVENVPDLMVMLSSFDLVVATRFHGVLLSLLAQKGVVALCYGAKTTELMAETGQGEYALDFESFSPEELESSFTRLTQNLERQSDLIAKNEQNYIEALNQQYEIIMNL